MLAILTILSYYIGMETLPAPYERDDRSNSFRMIGDVLILIAQNQGFDIDQITAERWRETMSLLREFDTRADDSNITREDIIAELEDFDMFSTNYPCLTPPTFDQEMHTRMVRRVQKILVHGDELASTDDVGDFIYHRQEEANETTELLADCATTDTTMQPGFYSSLMPIFRALGQSANYVDTLIDYRQDKHEGKVKIEKTKQMYLSVGRAALVSGALSYTHIIQPKVLRQLGTMFAIRAYNRVKNGATAYSTVKNLLPAHKPRGKQS